MVEELVKQDGAKYWVSKKERTKQVVAKFIVCLFGVILLTVAEALTLR